MLRRSPLTVHHTSDIGGGRGPWRRLFSSLLLIGAPSFLSVCATTSTRNGFVPYMSARLARILGSWWPRRNKPGRSIATTSAGQPVGGGDARHPGTTSQCERVGPTCHQALDVLEMSGWLCGPIVRCHDAEWMTHWPHMSAARASWMCCLATRST
jgi:hypothetical protein